MKMVDLLPMLLVMPLEAGAGLVWASVAVSMVMVVVLAAVLP